MSAGATEKSLQSCPELSRGILGITSLYVFTSLTIPTHPTVLFNNNNVIRDNFVHTVLVVCCDFTREFIKMSIH